MRGLPRVRGSLRWTCVVAVLALVSPTTTAFAAAKPPSSPPVGSAEWHAALVADAATSVPLDASPGYVDFVDGEPFSVETKITGVEFHVPGVPSSAPGGMSSSPTPVLRNDNGVEYWRVSGELSAQVVDYIGFRNVVGPIDPRGVNHRFDADDTHPRSRLPGAYFILRYPVRGFNGRLVNHQAPLDGGFGFPASPLLDIPVDPIALLDRGYALFTVALGGTVFEGDVGGTPTIDTNPDSGTGIFWNGELVASSRPARIAPDGTETRYAAGETGRVWDPFIPGFAQLEMAHPEFGLEYFMTFQWQPELLRDGIVVAKRLTQQFTRSARPPWTVFVGWSGSGGTGEMLSFGRVTANLPMPPGVVPYNGGNFDRFHDPSSGRRFDAFVSFAPLRRELSFVGDTEMREAVVDDLYPVGAPMVYIAGDADQFKFSLNGVIAANKIAQALPGSAQSSTPIAALFATYDVQGLPHVTHDVFFMNDLRGHRQAGLRYENTGVFPNPSGLNVEGRGHLVQPAWLEFGGSVPSVLDDESLWFYTSAIPRTTPLFLQTIENLHALTQRGIPLPTSHLETKLFTELDDLAPGDTYPRYAQPCPPVEERMPQSEMEAAMITCAAGVTEDSLLGLEFTAGGGFPLELTEFELDEARWFLANNPLPWTIGSIEVPDISAALGPHVILLSRVLERRLSDEQLTAGYTATDGRLYQLDKHATYVSVFREATKALVRARLWDRAMGAQYVAEAARSSVLR